MVFPRQVFCIDIAAVTVDLADFAPCRLTDLILSYLLAFIPKVIISLDGSKIRSDPVNSY